MPKDPEFIAPLGAEKMPMRKKTLISFIVFCLATLPAWTQARPYPGPDLPQLSSTILTS